MSKMTDEERAALEDFLAKIILDLEHLRGVDLRSVLAANIARSVESTLSPWWMIADGGGNGFAMYVRNSDLVIYAVTSNKFDFNNPIIIPPAMISLE